MSQSAGEVTDWMKPRTWNGNFWGPAAHRARLTGDLPPLPMSPEMRRWRQWGQKTLRDGDILFRLGDARVLRGFFPLSLFIARATGSPFSHTGVVAIENGEAVVYDCSSGGVQRQPFEIWMLDSVDAMGVKRLKPVYHSKIPGVLAFCRRVFEQQVPFDFGFRMDDSALYCVELAEKAFRSQGLALSEPVRIGDWEHLVDYPLTAFAIQYGTGLVLDPPINLDQPVYVPGNDQQGVWASPLLETVFTNHGDRAREAATGRVGKLTLKGDLALIVIVLEEVHRSYSRYPMWLLQDLVLRVQPPTSVASPGMELGGYKRHLIRGTPGM